MSDEVMHDTDGVEVNVFAGGQLQGEICRDEVL